jgi:hypothetical protein
LERKSVAFVGGHQGNKDAGDNGTDSTDNDDSHRKIKFARGRLRQRRDRACLDCAAVHGKNA